MKGTNQNRGVFEANIYELPQFYDKDAEAALIALAFEDVDNFSIMREASIAPDWFCGWQAKRLFDVFSKLFNEPGVTELSDFAVQDVIAKLPAFDFNPLDLLSYFREATGRTIPRSYLVTYISRLLGTYQRRLQYEAAFRWAQEALAPHTSSEKLLGLVEQDLSTIRRVSSPLELVNAPQLVDETEEFYKNRLEKGIDDGDMIPYKLQALQQATGGIRRKELTLVSAPPKVGKTALMQRTAKELAEEGHVVLYVSLEMPRLKWIGRILQQETGIGASRLERGEFQPWQRTVFDNLGKLRNTKLYLIDDPMCTTETVKRAIEHVQRVEGDCHAVFLDYAQLLKDRMRDDNETARYVAGELATIPKKYNTHLFAISNLNRSGELYGTVFLEYGCDNWWVVENEQATKEVAPSEKSGDAVVQVKYQRYGNSGTPVPVYWHAPYTRFTDRGIQLTQPTIKFGESYR